MADRPPLPPETPHPVVADDLVAAARTFFPDATRIESVRWHDDLARVETPAGAWKVRRWPAEAPETGIGFVHALLARAGEAGITAAPAVASLPTAAGETILARRGHRFDAQTWLPGRPAWQRPQSWDPAEPHVDLPATLPDETVVTLAETLARIHAAAEGLARTPGAPAAALPAVVRAVRRAWAAQRELLRPVAPQTPLVQRWLAAGERALPAAETVLERAGGTETDARAVLHLGLWPAHVLLDADGTEAATAAGQVVGLLGWEAAAVGSPVLDLAQLVARCRGWSAAAAELVLAAYADARPLRPEERRLLPAVASLDLVAATGRLLTLAYGSRPSDAPPPPTALRAGAERFVTSLESAAATLAQGDEPRKPGARRWERRPRPPAPGPGDPGSGRGGKRGPGGRPPAHRRGDRAGPGDRSAGRDHRT